MIHILYWGPILLLNQHLKKRRKRKKEKKGFSIAIKIYENIVQYIF